MTQQFDNKPHLLTLTTHPIQYQVPLFRALAEAPELKSTIWYASLTGAVEGYDREFGFEYKWDLPLLDDYRWELLDNRAAKPAVGPFFGTHIPDMVDRLRILDPDAVLIPGWGKRCYVQAMRASFKLGIPLLIRGEARLFPRQSPVKRIMKKAVVAPAMRRTAAVLPIGKLNRDFYKWCGVEEDCYFDSFYFVNNSFFSAAATTKRKQLASLRNQWNIPPGAAVFLFVGKFLHKKRPLDLLRALHKTMSVISARDRENTKKPNAGRDIHLLMVGDGKLRSECERYAREYELPVSFAGFLNQTELTDAYAVSDCLVLPSDARETWGLVVNEAMASHLTAIVSDQVGCGPDLIEEARTGFTFPLGDTDSLSQLLTKVVDDADLLKHMKDNAAARIRHYDIDQAVEGVVAAVRSVKKSQKLVVAGH